MPKIRTVRSKKPPAGFDEIEDTLLDFEVRLKDAESKSKKATAGQSVSLSEGLWPIYQLHHQRSRYIYDLYYTKDRAISSELYSWLLKNRYADAQLIAKWKKQGYEHLCCLRCIQGKDNVHGTTCICRVPKAQLTKRIEQEEAKESEDDDEGEDKKKKKKKKNKESVKSIQCVTCGCRGCASTD
ncbi:uncharacterized protein SAPINGB_P003602 [Magnusiomyces paraingens]|uniref:Pre-mRNA-splicing factor BUD31 n=1 Tax=Magnusiomyces paraingens TaxID=2606893 RepID=A0A5E8BXM7_9ASCO|nr:uncharacterized protein SAPINGB_P003602 [Saprochaete ingens]VVT53495.1 unnamed protein product [Saprochaete ingens]